MTDIQQEEKVQVTISIPTKDIALLAPINYEELSEKVYQQLDMSSLATDVVDNIDDDELCDKVIENLSYTEVARELRDHIDLDDYIDTDDIANSAADKVDISDRIHDLLSEYSPERTGCEINTMTTKAIIACIRYDLMCYFYNKPERTNELGTITDLLRKIILREMTNAGYPEKVVVIDSNNPVQVDNPVKVDNLANVWIEAIADANKINLKPSYTLDELYNTLSKIPTMNSELMNSILAALPKQ